MFWRPIQKFRFDGFCISLSITVIVISTGWLAQSLWFSAQDIQYAAQMQNVNFQMVIITTKKLHKYPHNTKEWKKKCNFF